ncbi:hypothetical protein BJX70DRAFT_397181 [Aspergillus crustosus]
MRFSTLLLTLSIVTHYGVLAEGANAKDALKVLLDGNLEALSGLKDVISMAGTFASVAGEKNKNTDEHEPPPLARSYDDGNDQEQIDLASGLEALVQIKNVASIASSLFSAVESRGGSSGHRDGGVVGEGSNPGAGSLRGASGESIDIMKMVGSLQQFASLASGFGSLGGDGENDLKSASEEKVGDDTGTGPGAGEQIDILSGLGALQQVMSLASSLGSPAGGINHVPKSSREGQLRGSATAQPNSGKPLDILKGLGALQQFASLASSLGPLIDNHDKGIPVPAPAKFLKNSPDQPEVLDTPPQRVVKPKESRPKPPTEPLDFIARLEALKTFTTLTSKLTTLTNTTDTSPLLTRLQSLFSDPEITSALHYIFSNAHKLLTPEILASVKAFARTTPLLPPEYLDVTLTVLDSMGAVFSPEFPAHYQTAKRTLDDIGIDLLPLIGYIWRTARYLMETFSAESLKNRNRQMTLYRKAFASDEMAQFLAWITDPKTIHGVTESVEKTKAAVTGDRIRALNLIFETQGLFALSDEEYRFLGAELGRKFKGYSATEIGRAQVRCVLHFLRDWRQGPGVQDINIRARALVIGIEDDIEQLLKELDVLEEYIPGFVGTMEGFMDLTEPLLDFDKRADKVLSWVFWRDINEMVEKVLSIPAESLASVQRCSQVLDGLLVAEKVELLQLLVADLSGSISVPGSLGSLLVDEHVNSTVLAMASIDGLLGLQLSPVLAADGNDDLVTLLGWVNALLAPGTVEKTRQTVQLLNQAGLVALRVVAVFEDKELAGRGYQAHDEL